MPEPEVLGQINIRTVLDEESDLAFQWDFSGVNDMEIIGLLVTVMVKHLFRVIRLMPRQGDT